MIARISALRGFVALAALALSACGTTPTHYYTLVGPAVRDGAPPTARFAIEVLPVDVPAQVDTRPLVLRAGNGRLAIEDAHEWAAPLPDELRQALSHDLSRTLGAQDVYGLPNGNERPLYRIKLVVTRFDSIYGSSAVIEGRWSVRDSTDKPTTLTCSSRETESVGTGYEALVEGHQRALAALAGQIADAVRSLSSGASHCP